MGETLKPIAIVLTVDGEMPTADLAWTDMQTLLGSDFNVAYYYVYKQAKFGQYWTRIAQVAGTTEVYVDANVVDKSTYRYYVSAVITGIGECAESNIVEVTMYTLGLPGLYMGNNIGGYFGYYAINQSTYAITTPTAGSYYYDASTAGRDVTVNYYVGCDDTYLYTASGSSRSDLWVHNYQNFTRVGAILNYSVAPIGPYCLDRTNYRMGWAYPLYSNYLNWFNRIQFAADRASTTASDTPIQGGDSGSNFTWGVMDGPIDSDGYMYVEVRNDLLKCKVFPDSTGSATKIKDNIVGTGGMEPSYTPTCLINDGEYIAIVKKDSGTGTLEEGMWLYIIRQSDGELFKLDLNKVANTYNALVDPLRMRLKGNTLFIASSDGLYTEITESTYNVGTLVDVTNPEAPAILSRVTVTSNGQISPRGIVWYGDYLYVAWTRYYNSGFVLYYFPTLGIWDISDPTDPTQLKVEALSVPVGVSGDMEQWWCFHPDDEGIDGRNVYSDID